MIELYLENFLMSFDTLIGPYTWRECGVEWLERPLHDREVVGSNPSQLIPKTFYREVKNGELPVD